jgi:hypothetical protein
MIRTMIAATMFLVVAPLAASQPAPRQELRDNPYPRWCQMYDRRDYWREKRACGTDFECRRHVERKAQRCGLR